LADINDDILKNYLIASSVDIRYEKEKERAFKRLVSYKEDAAEFLVSQFNCGHHSRQATIEKAIISLGDKAYNPLLRKLTGDNAKDAALAAYLLGKIKAEGAVVPLIMALKSPNGTLREAACTAIGELKDPTAVEHLVRALDDSLVDVRRSAAVSLGKIRVSSVVPDLITMFEDTNYSVRYSASYAIIAIGDTSFADTLHKLLLESKGTQKHHIIETIGGLKSEASIPVLMALTENPDYLIRGFAFQALSNYRGRYRIANAMKKGLNDNSGFVKMMAGESLQKIRSDHN